jgi:anti-sigma regulatory factor (Ser/Thr protein kinase)
MATRRSSIVSALHVTARLAEPPGARLCEGGYGNPGLTTPLEAELPRERICTALARRLVEQQYDHEFDRATLQDLKLVVSELVDNAYVHGEGRIQVRLEARADSMLIDVMDEGRGASVKIRKLGVRGGGHGLRLVDHLCRKWGSLAGATHVWAEMSVAHRQNTV